MKQLSSLSDEKALQRLTEIPGIGKYSAGIIYGRASLPVDSWSVVVLSELVLGKTPDNPRQDIDPLITRIIKQWVDGAILLLYTLLMTWKSSQKATGYLDYIRDTPAYSTFKR